MLVEVPFELEFASSNPGRFVPMDLSKAHRAILECYSGDSFPFPPTGPPIVSAQAGDLANGGANGNCFDISDRAENSEVH